MKVCACGVPCLLLFGLSFFRYIQLLPVVLVGKSSQYLLIKELQYLCIVSVVSPVDYSLEKCYLL